MPEGDTIHRTAATLQAALAGKRVDRAEGSRLGRRAAELAGATVTVVEARGKHLLIRFDNGLTLHTHMGMTGSWYVYRDESYRRRGQPRALLGAGDLVAACFAAPVVEVLDHRAETVHRRLAGLGPDLCRPDPDIDEVLRRLEFENREIGVVLLDQTVASGIGNVYKSESLFACGIDPFALVGSLDERSRRRLFATASLLLRHNLTTRGRREINGGGLRVYGRARRPCTRCGRLVRSQPQGEDARMTYWCPACQISR